MSDTQPTDAPRTDGVTEHIQIGHGYSEEMVPAAFARALERDLAEATAYAERAQDALQGLMGLVQLIHKHLPPHVRETIYENHRWRAAIAAAPHRPTRDMT